MAQALRTAWNANRHWLAAGFLASTFLFLLLMFLNWRSQQLGIATQKTTGLAATTWDSSTMWRRESVLPSFRAKQRVRAINHTGGTIGGVVGGLGGTAFDTGKLPPQGDKADRQVKRSGTLEIIVTDPLQAAEQLRNLAAHVSGFVVSYRVSGSDESTRSAQVVIRVPADRFDEAREQVRTIAKAVEQDTIEALDVTRKYVDQEARLRNARAEEAQYLAILKRATGVKDVLEVSSKLAEVRGRIDELETDLRLLRHEVEMSLLTINVYAMAEEQAFGIKWRPLYKARLSLRGALSALADYGDSIMALFLNFPVLVLWGLTVVALLKIASMVLWRIVLLFFPGLATWLHRPAQPQAT